jgi:hypothetical protein
LSVPVYTTTSTDTVHYINEERAQRCGCKVSRYRPGEVTWQGLCRPATRSISASDKKSPDFVTNHMNWAWHSEPEG